MNGEKHEMERGRARVWALMGALALAGAAQAAPPVALLPPPEKGAASSVITHPVSVEIPAGSQAVASHTALVMCGEGEQVSRAKVHFDGSLLPAAARSRVDRLLAQGTPATLVIRLSGFTWSTGEAEALARAEVVYDARLVDPQARPGAVVRHGFKADPAVPGSYELLRLPLVDVGSVEEISVLARSTLGGRCLGSNPADQTASVFRATVTLELGQ
jgi:hypothetical protein